MLCGNKIDLADERKVSREQGQQLADSLGVPYFETSAKTGENVTRLYQGLIKTIPRTGTDYKVRRDLYSLGFSVCVCGACAPPSSFSSTSFFLLLDLLRSCLPFSSAPVFAAFLSPFYS